jgi:hypothetical protein
LKVIPATVKVPGVIRSSVSVAVLLAFAPKINALPLTGAVPLQSAPEAQSLAPAEPDHVEVCADAFPAIASTRAGTRHKKCRKERNARVALEEKGDIFRFMETLRGLVPNAIIATK